ncbi:hypothetical protein CHS0354_037301 [Potamilus streckersoni]|uniref:Uncharacterized protein n=1 Tax=Potamilus streckersoni TaxID=2493646 RepID=A0AAE0TJN5_9BIVA|nr:hypothetical protein CHS0354_037301 [Potamilus streckersoni]
MCIIETEIRYAKLQANCEVPRPKTNTCRVQVEPECRSSAVECCRHHRTVTQPSIHLSSDEDKPGVEHLDEADYGDDGTARCVPQVYNLQHHKINIGSCLNVKTYCLCGFHRSLASQPLHHSIPWENLIIEAEIAFFSQWQQSSED